MRWKWTWILLVGYEKSKWLWCTNVAGRGFCVGVIVTTRRGGDLDKIMIWFQPMKMDQYVAFSIRFWFRRLVSKTFTMNTHLQQPKKSLFKIEHENNFWTDSGRTALQDDSKQLENPRQLQHFNLICGLMKSFWNRNKFIKWIYIMIPLYTVSAQFRYVINFDRYYDGP